MVAKSASGPPVSATVTPISARNEPTAETKSFSRITSYNVCYTKLLRLNQKYKLLYNEGIISDEEASNLLKTNKIFILALFITYLYLGYRDREVDRIKNKDLTADNLEIFVSYLSVIGGLIILYLAFTADQDTTAIYENPTL